MRLTALRPYLAAGLPLSVQSFVLKEPVVFDRQLTEILNNFEQCLSTVILLDLGEFSKKLAKILPFLTGLSAIRQCKKGRFMSART